MPELRGAPKMDGVGLARVQPFGKQVKAVQCLRCGGLGHQSGDKECRCVTGTPRMSSG